MTASPNRPYVPEIDQIRALAALLVLLYHGFQLFGATLSYGKPFDPNIHWVYAKNPLIAIIEEGHTGVSIFIVLSGFVLTSNAIGKLVHYRSFIVARLLRIYPVFLVCAVAGIFAYPTNILAVLTSILPLNIGGGVSSDFLAMSWAIAVEFQCYLIFPFLIRFSNTRGSAILIRLIMVALVLRILIVAEGGNARDISYWTIIGRIDQFCIGMITARLYFSRRSEKAVSGMYLVLAVLAAGVMLTVFNRLGGWVSVDAWKVIWPTVEGTVWAFFIFSYISVAKRLPALISNILAKCGEVSYSFYLIHFVVLQVIIRNSLFVRVTANGYYDAIITTVVVALPTTLMIAFLMYYTVEKPFLGERPRYIIG